MTERVQKMWVSKYALTKGLYEEEVTIRDDSQYVIAKGDCWNSLKLGHDVFPTREEAVQRAGKMRDAKLASLAKQISKLEKRAFY